MRPEARLFGLSTWPQETGSGICVRDTGPEEACFRVVMMT